MCCGLIMDGKEVVSLRTEISCSMCVHRNVMGYANEEIKNVKRYSLGSIVI